MAEQTVNVLKSEWYDKRETMKRLNIAERTLRTWVQEKRIQIKADPANSLVRLYRAADVENLAENGKPLKPHTAARKPSQSTDGVSVSTRAPKPQTVDALAAMKVFFEEQQATIKLFFQQRQIESNREHEAEFLTLTESAAFLRLPKAHIHRAVREGRLPAIQAGGWRIRRSQLSAFNG